MVDEQPTVRCPTCGSAALTVDPDDPWRRICGDCGEASRLVHTLFVGVGKDHFPLPAPQAEEVAAMLHTPHVGATAPTSEALAAAAKIESAVGEEAATPAFDDAELHQIGLALARLEVTEGVSQLGITLREAILRHTLGTS